jgi:hypothetical protein
MEDIRIRVLWFLFQISIYFMFDLNMYVVLLKYLNLLNGLDARQNVFQLKVNYFILNIIGYNVECCRLVLYAL